MSSFIQVGQKLRTLDKNLRMASTAMSSSTRALLNERLTSTAGWWVEAEAERSSFIRVGPHCARRHSCTAGWLAEAATMSSFV